MEEKMKKEKYPCCICGEHYEGWGNNPEPASLWGKCCKTCDYKVVIPARITLDNYITKYGEKTGRIKFGTMMWGVK